MAFNKFDKSRDNRGGSHSSFGGGSSSRGYEGSDNRSSGDRDSRSSGGSNRFGAGRSFGGGESRGGGRSFGGGGRSFGGHSDGPKQMFPATCGECGERCEVPFRPTGTHPVFCSNCFQGQSSTSSPSTRFSPPKSFGGGNAGASVSTSCGVTKAQIDTLNVKLDKILSLLSTVKTVATPKAEKVETEVEVEAEEKPKTSFLAAKKAKKAAKKK